MNWKNGCICLFIGMMVIGCQKDEQPVVAGNPTLSEALTGNKWQMSTLIVYQPADTPILNLTTLNFEPCEMDNYFQFGADNIFREFENTLVCSPQGNSIFHKLHNGPWLVNDTDSTLTIGGGFIVQSYKVAQWSNSKMRWQQKVPDYLGGTQIYEYTMTSMR